MGLAIAVASGKGGTGKSTSTAALGCCLAALGKRTLLIDGDAELRNLDLCLGLSDRVVLDYGDVLAGRCEAERALTEVPQFPGLFLLAAPMEDETEGLAQLICRLKEDFDYCLIDCPGGLGGGFRAAAAAADRALVVSNTDPCSHRDAARAAQALQQQGVEDVHLLISRVSRRFLTASRATLDDSMDQVGLRLIGYVPEDRNVSLALAEGTPLMAWPKKSRAAAAYKRIAQRLDGRHVPLP